MHFSQGWVQFGYRFSNDFAPFAVILVALAVERWRSNAVTRRAGRRVGPGQRVGRLLGRRQGMVNEASPTGVPAPGSSSRLRRDARDCRPARAGRPARPGSARWTTVVAATTVFVVSLALDLRTLLPRRGVLGHRRVPDARCGARDRAPTGYPTYTLLDWLASIVFQPFGNPAFRADLLSAVLVSGACALLAIAVVQLTRRAVLGLLAGIALAVSPLGWRSGSPPTRTRCTSSFGALLVLLLGLAVARPARRRPGPLAGRRVDRLRAVPRQPRPDLLLAPGVGLFVLIVEPELLRRRWRRDAGLPGRAGDHDGRGLRLHPAARGHEPAARLRRPGDLGPVQVPGARRAVPGHVPRDAVAAATA